MGQSRPIICKDCGNQWYHMDGKGFRSAIYYCNKCGDRKSIFQNKDDKLDFLKPENLKECGCGGTYGLDATIRCPKCKSKDLVIGYRVATWD